MYKKNEEKKLLFHKLTFNLKSCVLCSFMALISFIIDYELNSLAIAFSIDIVKQSLKNLLSILQNMHQL